jgi:hypothetical protein
MADPRSRKTGEHNPTIIKLLSDAVAMREKLEALEARVLRLEAELATRSSKRPGPAGPPPLPKTSPSIVPKTAGTTAGTTGTSMPALPKTGGRRSIVDISEIAELVESMPPPAPRSKK